MEAAFNYKKTGKFILVNAVIAFIISMFLCGGYEGDNWVQRFILECFLYSFIISSLLSGGINILIEYSQKKFSWLDMPVRRLLFDLLLVVSYSFVVTFITAFVFTIYVWEFYTLDTVVWSDITESTKFPIVIALGITFFFTSLSFLSEWRVAAVQTEQMKNERLAGQYQSLKDQLNPHFLFNSLNVLSNLVYEDADKSSQFIEKLSSVYRYVLEVQYERLVDLNRELRFALSYFELQKVRFGEKLKYKVNVEKDSDFLIPPLSLQLLLENAVKHNVATTEAPLEIVIYKEGNRLVVENNLQLRPKGVESSGIGLENIKKRYSYFTKEAIIIRNENGLFYVSIPLIKAEE